MGKVLIVGAGNVGAHIIHHGLARNVGAEFYLLDLNRELEAAQILDLKDTLLFSQHASVEGLSFGDDAVADMDVIVITAGANQAPGETRCDLLQKNTAILQDIAHKLGPLKESAVVMLVTNPVDILTHAAYGIFGLPENQIFGTGTLLDSARLKWRLAEFMDVNIKNVHGYVLGEHGDSEFVAWSTVSPAHELDAQAMEELARAVREEAYSIIEGKGATYFGISAATIKLLDAVLHDTHEVLPVSTRYPHTEHEALRNAPIGVPAIIGRRGIVRVPELNLSGDEQALLEASAGKLFDLYRSCPI